MNSKIYLFINILFIPILLSGQGIIIPASSFVIQSGGTIILMDNWTNDGTFTPNAGTVSFAGGSQQISGTSLQTFNNLTITSPAIVSIPAQIDVTVNNALTNNTGSTGLIIKSTAAGSGSLIHNTAGVAATVERFMVSNRWHIISDSPDGQSIPGFLANGSNNIPVNGSNYGMMHYSESGGGWVYYTNPASGNLSVGTGYLLRNSADGAVSLTGILNASNTSVGITQAANGWNCIGNPFPSSIGVNSDATSSDNFLIYNASELDPSFAALYLWDEPAVRTSGVSYYKIICNSGFVSTTGKTILNQAYMQSGQGFIVKAKPGGGNITFTTAMRVHENTGSFFKAAKVSWSGINLIINSTNKSASTAITLHQNMTRGLDRTFDAGLFGGDPNFRIYSKLVEDNGVNFMLQCLPDDGFENMRVPIGLDFKSGGSVTFKADIVPLPIGVKAFLVDSLLGKSIELIDSSSTYTADINPNTSGTGRFYLNLLNTTSISTWNYDNINFRLLDIYYTDKNIVVKGIIFANTNARLYDTSGRLIRQYKLQPGNINILPADGLPVGIYILHLFGGGLNENKKVHLE